jgi:hypothetical protein
LACVTLRRAVAPFRGVATCGPYLHRPEDAKRVEVRFGYEEHARPWLMGDPTRATWDSEVVAIAECAGVWPGAAAIPDDYFLTFEFVQHPNESQAAFQACGWKLPSDVKDRIVLLPYYPEKVKDKKTTCLRLLKAAVIPRKGRDCKYLLEEGVWPDGSVIGPAHFETWSKTGSARFSVPGTKKGRGRRSVAAAAVEGRDILLRQVHLLYPTAPRWWRRLWIGGRGKHEEEAIGR